MKALSLWQPWATLLVSGVKRVETRHYRTAHRGPLLIHAAQTWNCELANIAWREPFHSALTGIGVTFPVSSGRQLMRPNNLPLGFIVGRVFLSEVYRTEDVSFDGAGLDCTPVDPVWAYKPGKLMMWHEQKQWGDFGPHRFAYLCVKFERFEEPIPCRGQQKVFDVPDDVVKEVPT